MEDDFGSSLRKRTELISDPRLGPPSGAPLIAMGRHLSHMRGGVESLNGQLARVLRHYGTHLNTHLSLVSIVVQDPGKFSAGQARSHSGGVLEIRPDQPARFEGLPRLLHGHPY